MILYVVRVIFTSDLGTSALRTLDPCYAVSASSEDEAARLAVTQMFLSWLTPAVADTPEPLTWKTSVVEVPSDVSGVVFWGV